jgi:flagellar biosynthetic protein FlhB
MSWVCDHNGSLRHGGHHALAAARQAQLPATRLERRIAFRVLRLLTQFLLAHPQAAVVITNPTHYAVALAYGGDSAAPRLVAKGVDAMAARIRAAAEAAGVPLVANPPLARALWRLEVETEIPAEHYQAVAEIIAFVWRQRGAAARAGQA